MRHKLFTLLFLLCSVLIVSGKAYAIEWYYEFEEASYVASEEGKPILFYFYSPSCGYCSKMERETFSDPTVQGWLENFVCIKFDVSKYPQAAGTHGVTGVPVVKVISEEGELGRISGFHDPSSFVNWLQQMLMKWGFG